MNEQTARQITWVRAIEHADRERALLREDDRRLASGSARERLNAIAEPALAHLPTAQQFIALRAAVLAERVAQRHPAFGKFLGQSPHLATATAVAPLLAFLVGVAVDRIADPHRVDLLSAPLLGILAWNLAVYLMMAVWALLPDRLRTPRSGGMAAWIAAGSNRLLSGLPAGLQAAGTAFAIEWRLLSRRLDAARLARLLHLSAALFAAGAALSLYLRGFTTQYLAGWESTFLEPAQLHAILSIVFAPARAVFRMQSFSLADIEALRFIQGQAPGSATAALASGARWVHLYAASLLLLVILPRLLLAGFAHRQVQRLQQDFPLSLSQPYFRQLLGDLGSIAGAAQVLQVLPYSFALDAVRTASLGRLGSVLLGPHAQVAIAASTDYGALADQAHDEPLPAAGEVAITAVLFNLSATPEAQNHGAFLDDQVKQAQSGARQLLVLVDESGYQARLGAQAGAQSRVRERHDLWRQFCAAHHLQAHIVDLLAAHQEYPQLTPAIHLGSTA